MFPLHEPLPEETREELREYDDLTASLLSRRGVSTKEEAKRFLYPSYDDHLHDPLLMTDMRKAAERLARAITSKEKIVAWTDYDCDGLPAATLLHDFLSKTGANFSVYIPHRHREGYGVNQAGIEKLAEDGTKLIVTADSGITDIAAIARAKKLGMDVIVTDHHLPGESLPDAYAIVNPNARADEPYPFKGLCGAAVAWKLVCATLAVEPSLREKIPAGSEKWMLDMVGLATIADMVPLRGENRVLARYGLIVLRKSPRIGVQKLCRIMRSNQRRLTEDDIGFMLAPRVNAASRMGEARDAFSLFTTSDETEADMLAKKLEKLNRERKAQGGAITRAVHARLKERGEVRSVIALGDPVWRPSLLGLVANNIAEEYGRPVFLWGREENLSAKGSCRSGDGTNLVELMGKTVGTFVESGGHAASGGFTVEPDAIFTLEDRLVEAYEKVARNNTEDDLATHADAELGVHEATDAFLTKLERLAPFGIDNPKPLFLFRDTVLRDISRFGKGQEHLKFRIASPDRDHSLDAVVFFAKKELVTRAAPNVKGSRAQLLAYIERDTFSRGMPVRLRLVDLRLI